MNHPSSLSLDMKPSAVSTTISGNKRKDRPHSTASNATSDGVNTNKVTPTNVAGASTNPYETRVALLKEYRESAGSDEYLVWEVMGQDVLEAIPGKLEELEVDDVGDLTEEEMKQAYKNLSMEQVDEYYHAVIVRKKLVQEFNKFVQEIYHADSRNDPSSGLMMLNTYTSWCMYPIIGKQLATAQRLLTKATKAVIMKNNAVVPNIAQEAMEATLAGILACDHVDHWRVDTESSEDCDKIAKKVSKLLKELLWFHDSELGFTDPFSRHALLQRFIKLADDWDDIEWIENKVSGYMTPKNGKGMGRPSIVAAAVASAAKKPKVAIVSNGLASDSGNDSASSAAIALKYLNGLGDKLMIRTKTHVQLEIVDAADSEKSCRVVCTGAYCMKKLGQLVAYLTCHLADFHYHTQKGKSLKGSYFELSVGSRRSKLWIGEKALAKVANKANVGHVVDKTVKVVQVFQGLIMSVDGGMVYDSESSKTVSLTWVVPKGNGSGEDKRYTVKVQGIMPTKSFSKPPFLPRLVDEDNKNPGKKSGFGKSIHRTNKFFQAERKVPDYIFVRTQAEVNKLYNFSAADPICRPDGSVDCPREFWAELFFKPENIQSAGPPSAPSGSS